MPAGESSSPTENGYERCAFSEGPRRARHADGHLESPEIQTMYSLNMPVSKIRTKVRQEFEKHRYVSQLPAVDVLITQSHMEFQVRCLISMVSDGCPWLTADPGDTELLEATGTRDEVFQTGRRSERLVAQEFHLRISGGRSINVPL